MPVSTNRVAAWAPVFGAVPQDGGTRISVWAPHADRVDVVFDRDGSTIVRRLEPRRDRTFTRWESNFPAGTRYKFRLDGTLDLPDPASRFQPDGVHGASEYVDPADFVWTDGDWRGVGRDELAIYELHVGTFAPEGTFAGVESRLGYLADTGVTAIELMPIAEFAGSRNWGYDGVDLFAPSHHYGTPDDLRRLVNAAHQHGLAVLLDVVYNHLGPDGAYVPSFSREYFSNRHCGPWGDAVNLDGPGSEHVRAFLIENALHWIHEYHVDGLRLDATHTLFDDGHPHFLAELSAAIRAGSERAVVLVAEDERNLATLLQAPPSGYGLDAVWADDWHHQMRVALAGDREAYFADFGGSAGDIAATIERGWFYTGQPTATRGHPRGSDPSGLSASQFVVCLQNHDQVGNRAFGDRLHHVIDPAAYRAASVALLTVPQTPLLFMGQEWSATTPFLYFTDHEAELGRAVTEGRRAEFSGFSAFADPVIRAQIPDPQDADTFARSRLNWDEHAAMPHRGVHALYRTVLSLRKQEAALHDPAAPLAVSVPDGDTLVMQRGPWLVAVRLRGRGVVSAGVGDYDLVLTSEDPAFCDGGLPPSIARERGTIEFNGPAAVLMRRRG